LLESIKGISVMTQVTVDAIQENKVSARVPLLNIAVKQAEDGMSLIVTRGWARLQTALDFCGRAEVNLEPSNEIIKVQMVDGKLFLI
jgi:hypothetical protein